MAGAQRMQFRTDTLGNNDSRGLVPQLVVDSQDQSYTFARMCFALDRSSYVLVR